MATNSKNVDRALFKSVDAKGNQWLFAVGLDGGWKITRDGKQIALGTGTLASIDTGVQRFLLSTAARERNLEAAHA